MATQSSILGAFLVAQMVKNLPAMQETWVQSHNLLKKKLLGQLFSAWKTGEQKELQGVNHSVVVFSKFQITAC